MTASDAEAGFILRVVRYRGQPKIRVYDLRSGTRMEFASWREALRALRKLAAQQRPGLR